MGESIVNEKKSTDRRIIRTKLAIRDALVTLIKEKGFDALTISNIVYLANINRGTFYLHYKDKFDLLEQIETETLEELRQIFSGANSLQMEDLNNPFQIQQLVIKLLEYVKEHANLMHIFLGSQGNNSFITRIRSMVEQNLELGTLSGLNAENFLVPQKYLISYIMQAHLGVLQTWFMAECKESPQEMARILLQLSVEGPMRATGFSLKKV